MATFKTIRQTAARGTAPENYIRRLVACGMCPGVYSGNRFLVNVEALEEMMDKQSRSTLEVKTR